MQNRSQPSIWILLLEIVARESICCYYAGDPKPPTPEVSK